MFSVSCRQTGGLHSAASVTFNFDAVCPRIPFRSGCEHVVATLLLQSLLTQILELIRVLVGRTACKVLHSVVGLCFVQMNQSETALHTQHHTPEAHTPLRSSRTWLYPYLDRYRYPFTLFFLWTRIWTFTLRLPVRCSFLTHTLTFIFSCYFVFPFSVLAPACTCAFACACTTRTQTQTLQDGESRVTTHRVALH